MADAAREPRAPRQLRYPPGLIESARRQVRITRFKELVLHHLRGRPEVRLARPLDKLLPKGTPEDLRSTALVTEINKAIPLVANDLLAARLAAEIAWTTRERDFDEEFKERLARRHNRAHLVVDYFYLWNQNDLNFRELLLGVLDQGIGVYDMYWWQAIRRKFNPLAWAGFIVSIPVRVLIRAGLLSQHTDEDTSTALKWALGAIQAGWVAVIAYLSKVAAENRWVDRLWNWMIG